MVENVPRILAHRGDAAGRQPAQLHREHDDEDQAEPERRYGVTDDAEDPDHVVAPGAPLQRSQHAERDTDEQLDHERHERQLQRVRDVLKEKSRGVLVVDE